MGNQESDAARSRRRTRIDARSEESTRVGYTDETGTERGLTGDEDAPYIHTLGRTANADGSSPVVSAPGEAQRFLLDDNGRAIVVVSGSSASGGSRIASEEYETSLVIKSSPGTLTEVRMVTASGIATERYLHLFDAIGAPNLGDTPVWRGLLLPPGGIPGEVSESFALAMTFSTGIVAAISTTAETYTAPGSDEALFSAVYS